MSIAAQKQSMSGGNPYDTASATPKCQIGTVIRYKDGRTYRYTKVAETVAATNVLAAAPDTFDVAATYFGVDASTAPTASEGGGVGNRTIRICVVTGTKAMTSNEYAGGKLTITDGTGAGYSYVITDHQPNAATGSNTLTLATGLVVALDNTSVGIIRKQLDQETIVYTKKNFGGDPDEFAVGVACVAGSTSTPYLWMQTWGEGDATAGVATVKAGAPIQPAEDVDGYVQIPVATENLVQIIGQGLVDIANTKQGAVYWTIRP